MLKGLYPVVADCLHIGHILAMEEAKQNCDFLIVALNCCPEYKSPVQSIYERYMQLRAIKYVDDIIVYQGSNDFESLATSLDYSIRFLGEDYIGKDWDGKEVEERLGKTTYFLKRKHSFSSTNLKSRIYEQRTDDHFTA